MSPVLRRRIQRLRTIVQVDRNDDIYRRQRELTEELNSLKDLNSVRNFIVE